MLLDEQRLLHEDLERLEQAIADRLAEEPRHPRDKLARDNEISDFLDLVQKQSQRLLEIYDAKAARHKEAQDLLLGDPFSAFQSRLGEIKTFHRRYPNEPVENLERAYKKRAPVEGESTAAHIDAMFTGEETWGKFLDLTMLHEAYLNLPGVRRLTYIQYLDNFDVFAPPQCPIIKSDKRTDQYFNYTGQLHNYLEGFLRKTRKLEDLEKLFKTFDDEFEGKWEADDMPGWSSKAATTDGGQTESQSQGNGGGIWCAECQKGFGNENVYKAHLTGKKHLKAVAEGKSGKGTNGTATAANFQNAQRLKDRAIALREYRIQRLASVMQSVRDDTKSNVERKAGRTDKEREQELQDLLADDGAGAYTNGNGEDEDGDEGSDGEEKFSNPLNLPLSWDGKPIPFWLYKLHGLGTEFPCEICGNHTYMGRRAFDKHFTEFKHTHGLKALGITNTQLFREITKISEALALWEKISKEKKAESARLDSVVQMEDAEGNVMPEKVYYDLQKQGLL